MSRREEFVGVRVIDHVTDEGPCYSQWLTDEPIVRCRDCKHCFDWAYDRPLCKLWAFNDPEDSNASHGNALYPCVKPDGFCAWGERRDG